MIETLNGIHEHVNFKEQTHLRLYDNSIVEDYPCHWHRPVEIIMPIEGTYKVTINNETIVLNPKDIIFICPGVLHLLEAPDHGRRIIFQADFSIINNISGLTSVITFLNPYAVFTPEVAPSIHNELVDILTEITKEYLDYTIFTNSNSSESADEKTPSSADNNLYELAIYSLLIKMITIIGRNHISKIQDKAHNPNKEQEYISKFMSICSYIDNHFAEDLTLEQIAQISNFSKFHFSRLFKEFTNMTFSKYINSKRISYAEQLLTDPTLSITEVAISSGFSSQSAFIRMFKQFNDCTPSDFRKMLQQTGL